VDKVITVIKQAQQADIDYVCANMRQADRAEIWASHRRTPEAVAVACKDANPYVVTVNGVPCIIFGCSGPAETGTPWLLATDLIQTIGVRFIRGSRPIVDQWLAKYLVLENFVHADNELSIKWLKWLNFEFKETVIVNNEPFIRFVARRF